MSTQTEIDWSKPVQTKETPPRKVEIVTSNGRGKCPIIGYIGDQDSFSSWFPGGLFWDNKECEFDLQNTPQWQLPPPPEGLEWHRSDGWTEEMLPEGWRPLLAEEMIRDGDEYFYRGRGPWTAYKSDDECYCDVGSIINGGMHFHRTNRPLPTDPLAEVKAAFAAGKVIQFLSSKSGEWRDCVGGPGWFKGSLYRVKPESVKVQLGPDDVPPGSSFRMIKNSANPGFTMAIGCDIDGVALLDKTLLVQKIPWETLMARNQIKRPNEGWQPCYKEVEQ